MIYSTDTSIIARDLLVSIMKKYGLKIALEYAIESSWVLYVRTNMPINL